MSDQNNTGQGQSQEARRLEAELEALVIDNEHFQCIEKELDQFCPFEALGIVHAEIRHGTFLAYLLDPFRPHKFGSKILRILLLAAARAARDIEASNASLTPLESHLLDLDDADVRRHWRDIDLVIVL